MLFESIKSLKTDMIVGKDIIDSDNNRILLKKGTKLTEYYIEYLKKKGYSGIYIENEKYKDIIVDDVIPEELKNSSMRALKDLNIEKILECAERIVNEIIARKDISFDSYNLKDDVYEHSVKVAEMSIVMGKAVNLRDDELIDLASAALLHDIGKCAKDPNNLKKLNFNGTIVGYKEELYPLYGYQILKDNINIKATTKVGILTHNVNEDGSNNISTNKKIPQHLYGKIIHIADTYNQIVSIKYNGKQPAPSEAAEYLLGGCGTKFNKDLVTIFMKYVPIYPKGTKISLSNGIKAVVYENNLDNPLRPKIILETGELINLLDFKYNNVTISNNNEQKELADMLENNEDKVQSTNKTI